MTIGVCTSETLIFENLMLCTEPAPPCGWICLEVVLVIRLCQCSMSNAACYLPGLDSDTCHGSIHVDILHCNIGDACFGVVSSKTSDADPMARPTVYIMYFHTIASCLNWYTIITCNRKMQWTNFQPTACRVTTKDVSSCKITCYAYFFWCGSKIQPCWIMSLSNGCIVFLIYSHLYLLHSVGWEMHSKAKMTTDQYNALKVRHPIIVQEGYGITAG